MIRNYGLPNNAKGFFQEKALEGDIGNMKLLLKKGFMADSSTFSASLYNACFDGHINVIEFSLQNGADINQQSGDWKISPLMIAAQGGQVETTKFLLSHGANPHLKNKNGETALNIAHKYGKKGVVELLEKY
jgi:hypothetical protein